MFPDEPLGEEMSEDAGCSMTGTGPRPLLGGCEDQPRGEGEQEEDEAVLHHPCTLYLAAFQTGQVQSRHPTVYQAWCLVNINNNKTQF